MKARLLRAATLLSLLSALALAAGWAWSYRRPASVWVNGWRFKSFDGQLSVENRVRAAIMRRVELQRLQAVQQIEAIRIQLRAIPPGAAHGGPPPIPAPLVARAKLKSSRIPSRVSARYATLLPAAVTLLISCVLLETRLRRRRRTAGTGFLPVCGDAPRVTGDHRTDPGTARAIPPVASEVSEPERRHGHHGGAGDEERAPPAG